MSHSPKNPFYLVIILTLLMSMSPLNSQIVESTYQTYFGGELGKAIAHDVEYDGVSAGLMAGITTSRWQFELNYVYLDEPNPDGLKRPLHEFRHIGFDIGRIFQIKGIYLTPGVGIGHLTGSFRTQQIGREQVCENNSFSGQFCYDSEKGRPIYEYQKVDAVTFVPSIKALYKPFHHFGIGVNASGFINSDQGVGKITAFIGLFY